MSRRTVRCLLLVPLLTVAVEARAGQPLLPWRTCPCEVATPVEPSAIWYGWGGAVGRMLPVPPPPPPVHDGCYPPAVWYGWGGAAGILVPLAPHHEPPRAVPPAPRVESKGPPLTP